MEVALMEVAQLYLALLGATTAAKLPQRWMTSTWAGSYMRCMGFVLTSFRMTLWNILIRSDPPRADRPFGVTVVKPYSARAPLHCAACIPHLHPGNARC